MAMEAHHWPCHCDQQRCPFVGSCVKISLSSFFMSHHFWPYKWERVLYLFVATDTRAAIDTHQVAKVVLLLLWLVAALQVCKGLSARVCVCVCFMLWNSVKYVRAAKKMSVVSNCCQCVEWWQTSLRKISHMHTKTCQLTLYNFNDVVYFFF